MKFIKLMPFESEMDGDKTPCGLWSGEDNLCDYNDKARSAGNCDDSGFYYGTDNELEPKFCARHFYQFVVSGDGKTNYQLVDRLA